MKILVACEESGTVRDAFYEKGHDVISCDLLPGRGKYTDYHYQGDVFDALKFMGNWDMMIAFPPCTYLTVTGNKWLKDQPPRESGALVGYERRKAQAKAISFFKQLFFADIPKIAIENPVGVMSNHLCKPTQIIQPYQFGHTVSKKTCLWLKGLPPLKPTKIVSPDIHTTKSGNKISKWHSHETTKFPAGPLRSRERSKTFQGIADAMADQWG